jgi:hypothetical protein
MDAAQRAQQLLGLTDRAAARLASSFSGDPTDPVKHHLIRQEAENLFLFVTLSVLLEGRPGQDLGDRSVAKEIKAALAARIMETKKQAKALAERTLGEEKAHLFSGRLNEAAAEDPFAPYYDSFEKAKSDPSQIPFAVFARRVRQAHSLPASAEERLLSLSAELADELAEELHSPRSN